jgi:hypothetical protein
MSIFSILLILSFCYVLLKRAGFHPVLGIALGCKILAGICVGLIYQWYYEGGDTFQFFAEAAKISEYIFANPSDIVKVFFSPEEIAGFEDQLMFSEQPRALFFAKVVSVFYFLTGGNYWLISVFFSLISFAGIYYLVEEIRNRYNGIKPIALYSFFFLPTFIFWTSGLLKESLAITCLTLAVSIVLKMIRTSHYGRLLHWIMLLLTCWILWKLKYYYAAVAFPMLSVLLLYHLSENLGRWRPAVMIIILLGSVLVISSLHYNLNLTRLPKLIYNNYISAIQSASGGHIRYYHFDGELAGFLLNLPLAFFGGLFRPLPWETDNALQVIVAIENFLILMALLIALWRSKLRWHTNHAADLVVLLTYIISLSILIAFATPNFGTLSRYKVAYWPFFVMIALTLFLQNQKGRNRKETGL